MKLRLAAVRAALAASNHWPEIKRRLRALTDAELAAAEEAEKMGRRRQNLLRVMRVEQDRRAGRPKKFWHKLKVEVNL